VKHVRLDADDLAAEAAHPDPPPTGHGPVCESTGKITWRKRSKAANVAKRMRESKRDPFISEYRCPHCGLWHVGHERGSRALADILRHHGRKR